MGCGNLQLLPPLLLVLPLLPAPATLLLRGDWKVTFKADLTPAVLAALVPPLLLHCCCCAAAMPLLIGKCRANRLLLLLLWLLLQLEGVAAAAPAKPFAIETSRSLSSATSCHTCCLKLCLLLLPVLLGVVVLLLLATSAPTAAATAAPALTTAAQAGLRKPGAAEGCCLLPAAPLLLPVCCTGWPSAAPPCTPHRGLSMMSVGVRASAA
jgi:hypothetical protein